MSVHAGDAKLILCVVSAANDARNQEAISLARTADPRGKRTLTVFSKADMAGVTEQEPVGQVRALMLPDSLGCVAVGQFEHFAI